MEIYVSTSAFEDDELSKVLDRAGSYGIHNIELAPGLKYDETVYDILRSNKEHFRYLIHNYFPSQREPFGLNLASVNEDVIRKSMAMCKKNILTASEYGIPFYSIHCGFCFDTDGSDFGSRSQINIPRSQIENAKDIFISNIQELCDHAKQFSIDIAIENNVVAEFAANEKGLLLGVTAEDMLEIIEHSGRSNLRVLLDLAHAKVSGNNVGFSVDEMIDKLKEYIVEVHVSENNGLIDQNMPLSRESEMLDQIRKLRDSIITLEAYNLKPEIICEQIELFQSL